MCDVGSSSASPQRQGSKTECALHGIFRAPTGPRRCFNIPSWKRQAARLIVTLPYLPKVGTNKSRMGQLKRDNRERILLYDIANSTETPTSALATPTQANHPVHCYQCLASAAGKVQRSVHLLHKARPGSFALPYLRLSGLSVQVLCS